ncbi:EAL domain-containing protein [Paenibacillus sp. 481]|uniref:EAL domain-containing protein n=1 Tax=Paenibacillus sp. 481 TaxID=2835869 RepID=UPI001E41E841|nr:EAL domain-containing protein [Paenibacillus sp. 481]UHA73824.1 EAL domain-containing protein [Paenibacillus sp. 481]
MEHDHGMHGTYNQFLVILSYIIAVLASYSALDLAGRVRAANGMTRVKWLICGASAMGVGIWSMHFVGMLAFSLPFPILYDMVLVLISVVVAILAAFIALYVVGRDELGVKRLLTGGMLMATGISAMHYIGMEAMLIQITYDPFIFFISIVIAIFASIVALWLAFYFRQDQSRGIVLQKLGSGLIMGAAIIGMHYTGMEAARFHEGGVHMLSSGIELDPDLMSYIITGGSILTFVFAMLGVIVDKRLSRKDSELKDHEKWYKSLYENNTDGIISVDIKGRILMINPAAAQISGLLRTQYENKHISSILTIIVDEERDKTRQLFQKSLHGLRQIYETAIMHQDGHQVELSVINVPVVIRGEVVGNYVIAKDITEEKQAKERVQHLAFHDELTGLPNRRYLNQMITSSIEQSQIANTNFAILVLDIDRFKMINDSLGHAYGDTFLKMVSERLQRITSGFRATVARMGGDEFTVIHHVSEDSQPTAMLAEQLIAEIQLPYRLKDNDFYVSASIGIAQYPEHGDDTVMLLKNADTAMYEVKKKGKNGYQAYTEQLDDHLLERIELESDLRRAIERGELSVFYQPQIKIKDNTLIGIEALIRWNHATKGAISPALFIPIAEESGLIGEIGTWVLREACTQMQAWHEVGLRIPISVNLSTQQFHQGNLVTIIKEVLAETGLEPQYLELEITESMMMDAVRSTEILHELTDIGVKISMDDFGTGYSSLSYLKQFPIRKLKIDQSFIKDITNNENDKAIVATIISMAHHLKINVIAEGVETREQLACLSAYGCDDIQGYYFSKPLPPSDLEKNILKV